MYKRQLLDIRVQTNTGDYVNIEMFSKNQYQRFQIYGASLLSRQEKEGDDYQKNINHVSVSYTHLDVYKRQDQEKEIFHLYYIEGYKIKEIAKMKNQKTNYMKVKLHRIRKKLRRE